MRKKITATIPHDPQIAMYTCGYLGLRGLLQAIRFCHILQCIQQLYREDLRVTKLNRNLKQSQLQHCCNIGCTLARKGLEGR